MKKLFCKIGWHWMKRNHSENFRDVVSGKMVYRATCECGKMWNVDSKSPLGGFRVEVESSDMPIHDKCGLPAELCTCPDAPVVWDNERGVFVDRSKE